MTQTNLRTVRELMTELRVGRTKAYEMLAEGHIAHVRIGRKVLIPAAAIEEFERRHTKEARA